MPWVVELELPPVGPCLNLSLEEPTEREVDDKILLLMKDKNEEIQHQAVKCLQFWWQNWRSVRKGTFDWVDSATYPKFPYNGPYTYSLGLISWKLGLKVLRYDSNYDYDDYGAEDEGDTMLSDNKDEETMTTGMLNVFVAGITMITLLRHTNAYGGAYPKALLRSQVPRLTENLAKQMSSKSVQTGVIGYILLDELVTVLKGDPETAYIRIGKASMLRAVSEAASLLRKSNRPLKVVRLHFLDAAIRRFRNELSVLFKPLMNVSTS
ncbi:MAG: hypothetical protein J3Q66DRAFT_368647 [Benniella sp.]|nr:MAG: hypothetical protein J3Q66DRAFT_368647 [Benniella sp.]